MNPSDDDRAERALREALEPGRADQWTALDPEPVRRRLRRRRRRRAVVAAATAVAVVILGAVVLPRFVGLSSGDPRVAATPVATIPGTTVPDGWRLEQYRDVTIQVPDTWGYGTPPGSDWCEATADGKPIKAPDKPYVSLGSLPTRLIKCNAPMPSGLISEHVEITSAPAGGVASSPTSTERGEDGWWTSVQILRTDADSSIEVKTVSRDRALATRITDSARVGDGPCPANSEVQRTGSHPAPTNLDALKDADQLLLCQYDPSVEGDDGGFRAARALTGTPARAMAAALVSTLTDGQQAPSGCADLKQPQLELAVTVRILGSAEVYVSVGTCIDPADANTAFGGVDGGGTVRELPSGLCRQIVQQPIRIDSITRGPQPCGV